MNPNRFMSIKQDIRWLCLGIKLVSVAELAPDLLLPVKGLLLQTNVTEYVQTSWCTNLEKPPFEWVRHTFP